MVKKPRSGSVAQKRRAGKVTSSRRDREQKWRVTTPRDTHKSAYVPGQQFGGGDEEDEARLRHYASKNGRAIDTPGYSTAESMNAYFNAGRAEQEREWVSISDGEMLAYLEETVGGFRVGLGWPGTYRWSERAIVRRHVKGIPPESYPEEE